MTVDNWEEMNSDDPFLIGELRNGELVAQVVSVQDDALDGWAIKVFPLITPERIIVAVSSDYIDSLFNERYDEDDDRTIEEDRNVIQHLMEDVVVLVSNYFSAEEICFGIEG